MRFGGVQEVAKEMGYTPNVIAKRLVTNKSNTIGCFMLGRHDIQEETFGFHLIGGVLDEANRNEYDILLFTTTSSQSPRPDYIEMCLERQVEGAIFTGLRLDDPYLDKIQKAPFPIVIVDTEIEGDNIYCVTSDNYGGVLKAIQYLWDLSHERIAFISGHEHAQVSQIRLRPTSSSERRESYENLFSWINRQTVFSALQFSRQTDLTAVLVASDLLALALFRPLL